LWEACANTKAGRLWPLAGITEADESYLLESQRGWRRALDG
jgi:hypothetical protein